MTAINKTSAELLASKALASGMKKELVENILPYWINNMSHASGEGFYGLSLLRTESSEIPNT